MKAKLAALFFLATGCATIEFAARKPVSIDRRGAAGTIDSSATPLASTMPVPSTLALATNALAQETKLKNGIRVLVYEQHTAPLIALGVVLQRGSVEAPPGVFDLFIDSLTSGSDLISPKALHRNLFTYAIHRRLDVSKEQTVVSYQFVALLAHDVVRMLLPTFVTPSFDGEEFDDLLDQHKRHATRLREEPGASARRELFKLLYPGGHPYGDDVSSTQHPLDGVTVANVRALLPTVGADDVVVIVAGDTTLASIVPQIESAIGSLKPGALARKTYPEAPPMDAPHVLLLDHPHDSQAQLALGYPGVKYEHPDFVALFALSKIIQESARDALRLSHGVTYGVSGELRRLRSSSPLLLTAAVDAHQVTRAIDDAFGAIRGLESRMQRPGELDRIKSWIVANYTTYDTVDEALSGLTTLASFDLPVDYWVKFRAAILALTADDILRVAKQYLDPSHAQLVVLGDGAKLKPELEALDIAPVEMRQAEH